MDKYEEFLSKMILITIRIKVKKDVKLTTLTLPVDIKNCLATPATAFAIPEKTITDKSKEDCNHCSPKSLITRNSALIPIQR